jgi:hypothetical protein
MYVPGIVLYFPIYRVINCISPSLFLLLHKRPGLGAPLFILIGVLATPNLPRECLRYTGHWLHASLAAQRLPY